MNDLKLNGSHDVDITDGDLSLLNQTSEVAAQTLKINLLFIRGEWWLDLSLGVPYLESVLRKGVSKTFVDSVFRRAANNSYNIESVEELSSEITSDYVYRINRLAAVTTDENIVSITNISV